MKKLTSLIREAQRPAAAQMSEVSTADLKKYLEIASTIITPAAKTVIAWLIENPGAGAEDLKACDDSSVREAMRELKKYGRFKEVPIYMTADEFDAVMRQECTVDELLYDFKSERGRNKIAKDFTPMVHKIAHTYIGKSSLSYDELVSGGFNGLMQAILKYADSEKVTDENGNKKWISFSLFANQQIRFYILEDIKKLSHTVRIPTTAQDKERAAAGSNTKSYTVSGDELVGTGTNAKTRFETMNKVGDSGEVGEDTAELFRKLMAIINRKFAKRQRDISIFCDMFGIDRDEKLNGVEIQKKYGLSDSNVTRIKNDFKNFIINDRHALEIMKEIKELVYENKSERYRGPRIFENGKVYRVSRAGFRL